MGLTNLLVHRTMRKEADRLADWAAKTYPVIKAQDHDASEKEILGKMLATTVHIKDVEKFNLLVNRYCLSIEGLCYFIAMELGKMKGFMVSRCVQFTEYMDAALYAKGFNPQSTSTKRKLFSALSLPEPNIY